MRPHAFYWSVRREFWEYRALILVPAGFALLSLVSFAVHSVNFFDIEVNGHRQALAVPALLRTAGVLISTLVVMIAYSLGALHGERRDRSILFWKSLPVSDAAAVLAKAAVPLLVEPVFAAALGVLVILCLGLAGGASASDLASNCVILLYTCLVFTLWMAPVWGWLLLISAWAKRLPFLWAIGIPLGLMLADKIALGGDQICGEVGWRLGGWASLGCGNFGPGLPTTITLANLTPARFFAAPGLWGGLVVCALFIAAAIRLRRTGEAL